MVGSRSVAFLPSGRKSINYSLINVEEFSPNSTDRSMCVKSFVLRFTKNLLHMF